jgi:ATP-dependent protease ClpP protease subunit
MIYLLLFIYLSMVNATNIVLTNDNHIAIIGEINKSTAIDFVKNINNVKTDNLYIYINSPGGSVLDGHHIITYMNNMKSKNKTITCYADMAASMGFVILQACDVRLGSPSSILMQHQMSVNINMNLYNLNNYIKMVQDINIYLDKMQAERIGMDYYEFINKVNNDWWVSGVSAIKDNVLDDYALIECDANIKCPLLGGTIDVFNG